jgi:hypothetical protein
MAEAQKTRRDSAVYRTAKGVGFNARVEPMWYSLGLVHLKLGLFQRWRAQRKVKKLVAGVTARLRKEGIEAAAWDLGDGGCVCNLRVARMGMVGELQRWLQSRLDDESYGGLVHLGGLKDSDALALPFPFKAPFAVDGVTVASSPNLREELSVLNSALKIDDTFAIKKMVDFLDASEKDIAIYESRFGHQEGFWPKLTYVLLKKLCDVGVARKLPVHLA